MLTCSSPMERVGCSGFIQGFWVSERQRIFVFETNIRFTPQFVLGRAQQGFLVNGQADMTGLARKQTQQCCTESSINDSLEVGIIDKEEFLGLIVKKIFVSFFIYMSECNDDILTYNEAGSVLSNFGEGLYRFSGSYLSSTWLV